MLKRLAQKFGTLYDERNVLLAATHTHAGPGGYSQHAMHNFTSLGFVPERYNVIVEGITRAITLAHDRAARGEMTVLRIERPTGPAGVVASSTEVVHILACLPLFTLAYVPVRVKAVTLPFQFVAEAIAFLATGRRFTVPGFIRNHSRQPFTNPLRAQHESRLTNRL